MQIHIEHVSSPDYAIIESLLDAVNQLTIPLEVVDTVIDLLKECLVRDATAVGNLSCDIIEHIDSMDSLTPYLNKQRSSYDRMLQTMNCISCMENYKKAAVAAGAK